MRIAICDDEQFFIEYFTKIITDYYVHHGMTCEVVQYTNGFSFCLLYTSPSPRDA